MEQINFPVDLLGVLCKLICLRDRRALACTNIALAQKCSAGHLTAMTCRTCKNMIRRYPCENCPPTCGLCAAQLTWPNMVVLTYHEADLRKEIVHEGGAVVVCKYYCKFRCNICGSMGRNPKMSRPPDHLPQIPICALCARNCYGNSPLLLPNRPFGIKNMGYLPKIMDIAYDIFQYSYLPYAIPSGRGVSCPAAKFAG